MSASSLKRMPKGLMYGWGSNEMWELGLGANHVNQYLPILAEDSLKRRIVAIYSNGHYSVGLTMKGEVYTWGRGEEGQLGHGETAPGYFPRRVITGPLKKKKVTMVACGEFTCLAVLEKGSGVVAWGQGRHGELGQPGAPLDSPLPVFIPAFAKKIIRSIACGSKHCAAVVEGDNNDTDTYVWGDGANGKLGINSSDMQTEPTLIEALQGCKVISVHCGQEFTAVLTERGDVYTFGANDSGYLGHGHADQVMQPLPVEGLSAVDVIQLAAGHDHMAAVTREGELFTWGYGSNGRLGHGEEVDKQAPKLVEFFVEAGLKVTSVTCGGHHTCVVVDSGDLYTFGWNHYGQLGIGEPEYGEGGQFLPQLVKAVQGLEILQVVGGEQHTLALIRSK
eukprot:TRINITY_DN8940_c0_g1_i1.p1 TRINITY_DN8940_c0_g1~~TRINITY_DN8940_c0_g1_i1.p1  ORF type:complete len:392 (-),score=110.81 TRINITY_DN8940_c0_g1_i1:38-1213(-)